MAEAKRLREERSKYVTTVLEEESEPAAVPTSGKDEAEDKGMTREDFYKVLRRIKKAPAPRPSQPDQEKR